MQLADYKDLFIRLKDGTDITHDATSDWDLPFKKVAKCSQRPKAVADDLTNREHGQLGSRQEYPTSKTLGSDGSGIPPALQPVAQPRPQDRCFFLGSKKTRQSFIHKLNIGVCTRPPSTRRHCQFWFYAPQPGLSLSLIHISEPTRLGMISY